jgi:hypothetical protein
MPDRQKSGDFGLPTSVMLPPGHGGSFFIWNTLYRRTHLNCGAMKEKELL